jgi:signal transduction histidine kinase
MVAFAIVIVLLATGMGLALRRVERVTRDQLTHVQSEEYEITLVERLRWSGELLVSAGRGYLISPEPAQLANLNLAKRDFDAAVDALKNIELSPRGTDLLEAVRMAAMQFEGIQQELLQKRGSAELGVIVEAFETELLPARVELRRALDRLVGHKSAVIERVYADAEQERSRLLGWTYLLLGALVFGCLGIGWWSALRLARTYRREAVALETARKALASRDELMGIVAHDLRSPLSAITMRAERLQETASDASTREQAAAINNTATRMSHLIKTMLDVAVAEAGKLAVDPVPNNVDHLVGEAIEMVSTIAAAKQVHLELRVPETGLVVLADRERVFQVLANLLGNAIKFTPTGGRVTVAVDRTGDVVTFSISDTGPGIAADHLPRVFDRYWKDDSRTTKGTGLGLFISKSIVDAHGGTITAESPPNRGATFRFTLRLAPAS